MAKHAPRFLQLVSNARQRIREVTVHDVKARRDRGETFHLVDVREDGEWSAGHLPGATHIGKGIIERDIEGRIPDLDAEIVLYCGGGYRSVLAADSLLKMGYRNVVSMDGGIRGWRQAEYPMVTD